MKYITLFDEVLARLKTSTNTKGDTEFARAIGLSQSAVSNAKTRGSIPPVWIETVAKQFNISANWLFFGEGSMHRGAKEQEQSQGSSGTGETCARCERLEDDNRELMRDNRELVKEIRELMRENGDLRVELAELKAVIPTDTHRRKAG